ncbi:MAG: DUF3868 domain-containing protein [Muribaculaceae bacterium]|nr:DUF3868 domain-containing protein [Muribaculaceae bacterium]
MNKILCTALMCAAVASSAHAKDINVATARITNIDAARTDNNLFVAMDIDMSDVTIGSNQELVVTPVIYNATDSLALQPLLFAGRNRYFNEIRNGLDGDPYLFRSGDKARTNYRVTVPYQPWMSNSEVKLNYSVRSCCNETVAAPEPMPVCALNMEPPVFAADFVYIAPDVEIDKFREEAGSAFVDFVVNKTDIRPTYRNNAVELGKIQNTIDLVRNDKDVTITGVDIHGYASPEGPYDNNVRLAKGRTEALKQYVRNLYKFEDDFITTAYTPEDWGGLRKYVENSNLENRQGILDIIDSDLAPDPKNTRIQTTYPEQYAFLLKNEYPALRHSDYVVRYKVRAFYDPQEILKVMRTAPQKLSLAELYAAAQSLEPGSDEYNEVFDVAVRMFPADPVANLNAANAAMGVGNYKAAERYLDKVGSSDQAEYARGVLDALQKRYSSARAHFSKASGVPAAAAAMKSIDELESQKNKVRIMVK